MSEAAARPEVWFYHLLHRRLEAVLPNLLEKSRARGWIAAVQATGEARLAMLDDALWTFSDESFLAHGREKDGGAEVGEAARQPILLTLKPANLNRAAVRFFVDGAEVAPALAAAGGALYQRCILLFDGNDAEALAGARAQWRSLKAAGCPVTYWQEDTSGRFEKQA